MAGSGGSNDIVERVSQPRVFLCEPLTQTGSLWLDGKVVLISLRDGHHLRRQDSLCQHA